jgi:hypothetical protein
MMQRRISAEQQVPEQSLSAVVFGLQGVCQGEGAGGKPQGIHEAPEATAN